MQSRLDAEKEKALMTAKAAEEAKKAKAEAEADYERRLAAAGGDPERLALEDARRAKDEQMLAGNQFRGRSGSIVTMESCEDAMSKLQGTH